jgi:hypothetical protein
MNRDLQGYRTVRLRTLLLCTGIIAVLAVAVGLWKREALQEQVRAVFLGNAKVASEKYGWKLSARVDAVEIYEIEEASKATNKVTINIGSHTEEHGYGSKRNISEDEAKVFMGLWSKMEFDWELSAACHDPAFVLRFLNHGHPELEITLCFHCQNFQYPSLFGTGLMGFSENSPSGQDFLAHMRVLFPESPKWVELAKARKSSKKSEP